MANERKELPMLDPNKVKIGIAPIAWTEDDMPEMGAENSFLQTISEIALSGYAGTEIGCQYPRDPAILNREFARRGISAITAWISTYLNEQPLWWNERAFVDHMNFLKSIGATVINTSDQSFSIQHQWNTPLANKKVLDDDEWEVLTKGLNHLGKIAYDSGMKIVYHHHMTTTVQTTAEIDRMLAMTDPKYVSMIYDTGHLTFSGEDPIEILKKHHDRIGHVHLKNVRRPAMDKCYAENKSFLRSIPDVRDVHDLHVWTMSPGHDAVQCHLSIDAPECWPRILREARTGIRRHFGIDHVTIQPEWTCRGDCGACRSSDGCPQAECGSAKQCAAMEADRLN